MHWNLCLLFFLVQHSPSHHITESVQQWSCQFCILLLLSTNVLTFLFLFTWVLPCMLYSLICLLFQLGFVGLHFTLNLPSNLTSGIPSSSGPPPGTTKNLHSFYLFLCLMVTQHTPYWRMHVLLHMFNMTLLLLCLFSCSNLNLGKNILKILRGFKLPWLMYQLYILF